MYRVALTAGLAIALSGCSLGSSSLSSGFAEQETTSSLSPPPLKSVGLGGDPAAPRSKVQVAKLDDKAPSGTYEKRHRAFSPTGITLIRR